MATLATFDPKDLEAKVKAMYSKVAEDPHGEFHFEMGRAMAERLGYAPGDLDRIPAEAIKSFAGVGYYFDLADLKEGEKVVDLGSGSGMDTFVAALKVGPQGLVIGIDMTDAQLDKAERLRAAIPSPRSYPQPRSHVARRRLNASNGRVCVRSHDPL
jgi:SAM-dependent methyltransferase